MLKRKLFHEFKKWARKELKLKGRDELVVTSDSGPPVRSHVIGFGVRTRARARAHVYGYIFLEQVTSQEQWDLLRNGAVVNVRPASLPLAPDCVPPDPDVPEIR